MGDFKEICYILVGYRLNSSTLAYFLESGASGSPVNVEFSWKMAMEREEKSGDVVGFFHTHPPGIETPSTADVNTMKGWVLSLGKPLLSVITSGAITRAFVFTEDGYEEVSLIKSYNVNQCDEKDSWLKMVFIAGE